MLATLLCVELSRRRELLLNVGFGRLWRSVLLHSGFVAVESGALRFTRLCSRISIRAISEPRLHCWDLSVALIERVKLSVLRRRHFVDRTARVFSWLSLIYVDTLIVVKLFLLLYEGLGIIDACLR